MRRTSPKQQREQRRQRMVLIGTGVAVALALLALVTGLLYDQVYVPSQTVASVNDTSLSRRTYWEERRYTFAREVVQSFQLDALLAGQSLGQGQDFTARVSQVNQQIDQIRSLPVDEATLGEWQSRTLIEQGAQQLGVSASSDEVNQRLAGDLGDAFLPPSPDAAPTPDPAAAATASVSETAALSATATAAATPTPEPTLTAQQATGQADEIVTAVFDKYKAKVESEGQDVELARDDFVTALDRQYRQQVLTTKIGEQLVPEQGFMPNDTPTEVKARHILCKLPDDVTEEQREAEYANAKQRCDAIYAELQGGADFDALAREKSEDEGSKDQGGDLGFFGESSGFDPEFVQAAFALADGEISQPVRTQFGYHVIQTQERRADPLDQQLQQARTEAFEQWLNERRGAATLVPAPTPTPEPTVAPPSEPSPEAAPPPAEVTTVPAEEATAEATDEATSSTTTSPAATSSAAPSAATPTP